MKTNTQLCKELTKIIQELHAIAHDLDRIELNVATGNYTE